MRYIENGLLEGEQVNKRVLVKAGLIERRSLELHLTKVEGVAVDQDLLGQIPCGGVATAVPEVASDL